MGTGGGWVKHKLTLTHPDPAIRSKARDFIASIVDAAGAVGAPAIIGSMQGRWGDDVTPQAARGYLTAALEELGERAKSLGVPLLYEPLNRYETNLITTLADGVALLRGLKTQNVKLLADLYHMNIEEADLGAALREAGSAIGHVHLADSNRRPAGNGHTDFAAIANALRETNYPGYISAECFPWPDPDAAAAATMSAIKKYFA
jgi:sugar phosphate isomerase/epimerase